ncbi:type II toxin-antitoxin system RelE/ParE family toxin [Phenylobacterium sp. 20VBR1]|uniref:Type II toxin-antitoxin system RelE/ParE family toxin n=1 Tax=Phenylobacterium glaciei TaxID=2803784 RepID=A0A941D5U5_9CAUL|nr:type II toxin-antitoxin system RelE/ParE family toxin [Phenylobacterium glaciei]MBR7621491.1 type II toxin-antitoxin system RelE/ParE family toxin [Phenylobacterium glaciei]QQZ50249.1 type II toxin-antitoxin system RelE/ParE family toxin [Phenylobacterium glaciei]
MSWEVRRTRRAEADLVDIWIYIAADSPAAAERVILKLEAAEGRLAEFPEMAPLREDLLPGVRAWAVGDYLIFYRVEPDAVEILRILHGARDLDDLIGG